MSSQPPPDGPGQAGPGPQPQPGPPDTVSFGAPGGPTLPAAPPAASPGPGHRSSAVKIVAVAAAAVLLVGGGAYAFVQADPLQLFRSGPQAAEAVPADALAYASLDLDPSATQKIDALRFLSHFPSFEDVSGITDERADIRKAIFDEAIATSGCPDVTFDDDVDPWLGDTFAIAVLPPAGDDRSAEPEAAVVIEVDDTDAAADGLAQLQACGDGDALGYAPSGEFMVLAETQARADAIAAAAADSSLADDDEYQADLAALGDEGVATAWVDVAGLVALDSPVGDLGDAPELDAVSAGFERLASTFRFHSDHVEVVTKVYGGLEEIDHPDNAITGLPDSTVFALSEAGGGERVGSAWQAALDRVEAGGGDPGEVMGEFEDATGLALPDDLQTLLGDNALFAIDARGIGPTVLQDLLVGGDVSGLHVGARFAGDGDALDDLYSRVTGLMGGSAGPLAKVDFDDGFALATNEQYGEELADLDGGLGDSAQFQSVIDDAADAETVVYLDFDQVEERLIDLARQSGAVDADLEDLQTLRAFGLTGSTEGDYTTYTATLSVND